MTTETTSSVDIDAIRQREQAATEGPWPEPELDESEFAWVVMNGKVGMPECAIAFVNTVCDRNAEADAEFIAHARTDVPALLAKVDELTAELAGLRADVESLTDDLSAVRTERDAIAAKLNAFKPVAYPSGEQLYAHRCNNVEWWHEPTQGPINEQGCDACESAPDGTWRPVYVRGVTR